LRTLGFPEGRTPCQSTLQRLFCHEAGIVLAHEPIATGGDKAEAELTVAPTLLAQLDWGGRVLTGDARFCQRAPCAQGLEAGGDYLLLVKDNQSALHKVIALWFDPPPVLTRRPVADWRAPAQELLSIRLGRECHRSLVQIEAERAGMVIIPS
jgi:hypothetical protein